ncbi:FtsX-like permease family protein [Nocardioides terrisoli]|uniref:FtsX-like permease family protein n=1 Tax=Nocardioides terrisoli TaxID=3388267 RepID=UPI00287B6312|nr:FtsX-like permease family protein [Nocardioides marmorisolisilvae]
MRGPAVRRWRAAVRHRPLQALSLFLLAALVAASATFAPLYVRAVGQVIVDLDLAHNPSQTTGLQVSSHAGAAPGAFSPFASRPPLSPAQLIALVPRAVRADFEAPVIDQEAFTTVFPDVQLGLEGTLISRSDICAHLTMVEGRCPRAQDEIAISEYDRRHRGLHVGRTTKIATLPPPELDAQHKVINPHSEPQGIQLRVVGVYHQVPGPYWFGRILTGKSGIIADQHTLHDDWVTIPGTITNVRRSRPMLPNRRSQALFPIDPAATGLDQFRALGPQLRQLDRAILKRSDAGQIDTYSGLPDLVKDLNHQLRQAQVTVPLLMLQLGLLCLFVLWLVLGAATEQRRPEVALALLRGRGRSGARRMLLAELLPVTLAGVGLGTGLALFLAWVCRTWTLPGSAPFEVTREFWLALVAAVVAIVVTTVVAVVGTSREPVETLLRRVSRRSQGWRLGALQTLLIAVAGTGAVAFVVGALDGSAALAGPALLALTVGLLLSHLTVPVAARIGGWAVGRGRIRSGLSILSAARLPMTRRTVAVVTVATALLVFSADAIAVGARNRQLAAEQYVGAPRVLTVNGNDLPAARAAVDQVDPSGHSVTPVVTVRSPGEGAPTTLAVVPDQFRRIAMLDVPHPLPWQRIEPPAAKPVRITGGQVTVPVDLSGASGKVGTLSVTLSLVYADHSNGVATLGDLDPKSLARGRFTAAVSCRQGCLVSGIGLSGLPGARALGTLTLGRMTVAGGTSVPLGPPDNWSGVDGSAGRMTPHSAAGGGLRIDFDTEGSESVTMPQRWFPTRVPAIVVGSLPPTSHGNAFALTGLDGQDRDALRVASAARAPSAPPHTAVVNLDVVQRGSDIDIDDKIQVWLGRDDPALVHRVESALADHQVSVQTSASVTDQRQHYDRTAAAWGLELAVITGALALLIALLVLVVLAVAGWRLRARDLAALRMSGLRAAAVRTVAASEQLVPVLLAVIVGTVCGLVGADLAMGSVPLFSEPPEVSTLDLALSWPAVAVAALAGLVVLAVGGALAGRAIAARADLQRLRGAP